MYNNLTIVANLVKDFVAREGETTIAVSRIASTFNKDQTIFMNVKAFGKTADILLEHGKKGTKMLLSGKLQMESWKDSEGKNRTDFSMIIDKFEFIAKPKEEAPKEVDTEELPF